MSKNKWYIRTGAGILATGVVFHGCAPPREPASTDPVKRALPKPPLKQGRETLKALLGNEAAIYMNPTEDCLKALAAADTLQRYVGEISRNFTGEEYECYKPRIEKELKILDTFARQSADLPRLKEWAKISAAFFRLGLAAWQDHLKYPRKSIVRPYHDIWNDSIYGDSDFYYFRDIVSDAFENGLTCTWYMQKLVDGDITCNGELDGLALDSYIRAWGFHNSKWEGYEMLQKRRQRITGDFTSF